MRVLFAVTILLAAPPRGPLAQTCQDGSPHAFLSLSTPLTPWDGCSVVLDASQLTSVSIVVDPHVPMTKVRFSLQNPSFGVIVNEAWNYPTTGTVQSGVEVDLQGCLPGPTTELGTLQVFTTDPAAVTDACAEWKIDAGAEIEDCNGATHYASSRYHEFSVDQGCCFYIDCPSIPPYDLYPPDGATDVPVDVELSWAWGYGYFELEIGTDPECYTGQLFQFQESHTFSPDFLQPSTTYYWRVGWSDGLECGGGSRRVSFTTDAAVPTEETTWGAIKSLYE